MLFILSLLASVFALSARATLDKNMAGDGVVYADDRLMRQAFTGTRDFTVALLLTGEGSSLTCDFCDVLGPNFRQIALSYAKQHKNDEKRDLYFVLADFENCMPSFRQLGVQQIPNLAVYPPTQSRADAKLGLEGKHQFMSFKSSKDQLDYITYAFSEMGFPIAVIKPFRWDNFLKFWGIVVVVLGGGIFFRARIVKVWLAKQIWLALSLMCIVMGISGHMFNVTRGTSFMGYDGNGLNLVDRNFSSQFAVETQIVATLYALLSFTTIGLIKFVPKMSLRVQTIGAIVGTVLVLVIYSVFLQLFSTKMGGYLYTILPISLF